MAGDAISLVVARLDANQVKRAWNAMLLALEDRSEYTSSSTVVNGFAKLVMRMEREDVEECWARLESMLYSTERKNGYANNTKRLTAPIMNLLTAKIEQRNVLGIYNKLKSATISKLVEKHIIPKLLVSLTRRLANSELTEEIRSICDSIHASRNSDELTNNCWILRRAAERELPENWDRRELKRKSDC